MFPIQDLGRNTQRPPKVEAIFLLPQMNQDSRRLGDRSKRKGGGPALWSAPRARQTVPHSNQREADPAALGDASFPWGLTWPLRREASTASARPVLPRTVLNLAPSSAQPRIPSRSAAFQSPRSRYVTRRRAQPPGKCGAGPDPLGQFPLWQTVPPGRTSPLSGSALPFSIACPSPTLCAHRSQPPLPLNPQDYKSHNATRAGALPLPAEQGPCSCRRVIPVADRRMTLCLTKW